jgi:hypothetical protein
MADFNVRSDAVDVEQIMRQIRARIREKRGVDYTEAEIQQLAKVKLEKFLDPRGIRSDLVDFRRREYTPSPPLPKLELEEFSIYGTHRGLLRWFRQLLNPILKLFVNPQPLVHFVWTQAQAQADINEKIEHWMRNREQSDIKLDPLYYEILHNLVLELTRTGIEVHNLKMRVESLSSRVDFDERRSRSLERVVEYRPVQQQRPAQAHAGGPNADRQGPPSADARPQGRPEGDNERRRRRRRRRRRPGQTMADQSGMTQAPSGSPGPEPPSMSSAPAEDDSGGHDDGASDQ